MENGKKPIKEGKKSVSEKVDLKDFLEVKRDDSGLLMIPANVKKFAAKHGLNLCWRSYNVVSSTDGYDPDGWVVFKRELLTKDPEFKNSGTIDGVEFGFGGHTQPVYRRGDLILCYMQGTEWQKARTTELRRAQKAALSSKSAEEIQAQVGKALKITNIED